MLIWIFVVGASIGYVFRYLVLVCYCHILISIFGVGGSVGYVFRYLVLMC